MSDLVYHHSQPATVHSSNRCISHYNYSPYHTVFKVTSVALACLTFFGLQMGFTWMAAGAVAAICSTVTLLSELFLRTGEGKNQRGWYSQHLHIDNWFGRGKANIVGLMIIAAIRVIAVAILVSLFSPIQTIAYLIMSKNIRIILLVTLIGPIAEEILFRGFLKERLEDLGSLVEDYIYPISACVIKPDAFGDLGSSILFGSVHIIGDQVIGLASKVAVFVVTACLGLLLCGLKDGDESMISPIIFHISQNVGFTLGILLQSL